MSNRFTITVQTSYGTLVPQTVVAPSLRDALQAAIDLPFPAWIPEDDDDDQAQVDRAVVDA